MKIYKFDVPPEVVALIRDGVKIQAIKKVRYIYDCDLHLARLIVEVAGDKLKQRKAAAEMLRELRAMQSLCRSRKPTSQLDVGYTAGTSGAIREFRQFCRDNL